jgi:hypothetical protein
VLSDRQKNYAQLKRELWGTVSAVKSDREYLIGAEVVIETDFLPILGMISGCNTPDIAMLWWIAYIKSLNPEIQHIAEKRNIVADMLSRARYEGGEVQISDEEDVGSDFFTSSFIQVHTSGAILVGLVRVVSCVRRRSSELARSSGLLCACVSKFDLGIRSDSFWCGNVHGVACSHSDVRTEISDQNRMFFFALRAAAVFFNVAILGSAFFSYNYFRTTLS